MRNIFCLLFVLNFMYTQAQSVQSSSKEITLTFKLSEKGKPSYTVFYKNNPVILESFLGIKLKDGSDLASNFTLTDSKTATFNETWQPVLGEQANIINHYNELTLFLKQLVTGKKMNIVFRVFDEGVAFRYDFPQQENLNYFIISDEISEFNLAGNHKVFWMPGDFDSNEYIYN